MAEKKNIMNAITNGLDKFVEVADPYIPKVGYVALLVTGFCWGWMKADLDIRKKQDQNH